MENDRQETLVRLMEEHGDRLYRLCLLLLRDPHLAEDAVQDTMLKAWRGLERFEQRASEKTWLTAIAVNVCRDYRRLYWYRKRLDSEELLELTVPEIAALLHEKENTVSTRLRRARAQLRETLKGWDDDG